MDSHATDQCHDKHACGRREQLRYPSRHREVEAEERDLGGVFVGEDNDQQDEKTPRLRRSLLPMSPQPVTRVRVAAAGQDGAAVPAAEESLVWGRQAVGSAESGCRGVVQWWGEGLVGERAAAYEGDRSLQPTLRDPCHDPERTELEVSGVEDEALPDLVGKFDAVEGNTRRALGMLRDRPADHEKAVRDAAGAVDGVGRKGPRRQHYEAVRWGNRPGKSPAASLTALYGYASNTPRARNGRYTDPMLEGQVGNLPGTSKQQLRIRSVLDVPADTFQRSLRPLRQLLPERAWDGGESVVSETLGEPHHPMGGLTPARSARSATVPRPALE